MSLFACNGGAPTDGVTETSSGDTSTSGDSGSGSSGSGYVASGVVSGIAFDSAIDLGDVSVYSFSNGSKGVLLGEGTTGDGIFSLRLESVESQPVMIEVSGGYYYEEASNTRVEPDVSLRQKMFAVSYYTAGETLNLSVTFLTTLAAGYAEYLVTQGETATNAVITANNALSAWAGFDVIDTVPVNVSIASNASSTLTDALKYGFISAGLSQFSIYLYQRSFLGAHEAYQSISVYPYAFDDIKADGLLDGKNEYGDVTMGDVNFDRNTYRSHLAARMLDFTNTAYNRSSLLFDDVRSFAVSFSSSENALFGYVAAPDIFEPEPVVVDFYPSEGETVVGTYSARATVSDVYGLKRVTYYVDGVFVAGAGDPDLPIRAIDTRYFSNGLHAL
ncbi:MAG: hypothetical protein OQK73_00110, partial [Gammaproteobacteria bacterium]|nr:hypothetical protein [Gammaproteobacteria bacterium]